MSEEKGCTKFNAGHMENVPMRVAIMQPYFFPYIGYFQLLASVDVFILYDDVNYIKKGWINRNRVLGYNGEITFSVPLSNPSQNLQINEVKISNFTTFTKKFKRTLEHSYGKSKYYEQGLKYVDTVLSREVEKISELAAESIKAAAQIFEIQCNIFESSKDFSDSKGMERSQRLISMATQLSCTSYVNSIKGSFLYDRENFQSHGVELKFIKPEIITYEQFNSKKFIPGLSIIDMLMNLSVDEIQTHLKSYELV